MAILWKDQEKKKLVFTELESYNDFDAIVDALRNKYKATILKIIDGPESRLCDFSVDGRVFSLVNNPYGNHLEEKS